MIGNTICDAACNTLQCAYDQGDCAEITLENVTISSNDLGNLTNAITHSTAQVTIINLNPGLYPLNPGKNLDRIYILNNLTIQAQENTILQITNSTLPFIITGNLTLQGVTLEGNYIGNRGSACAGDRNQTQKNAPARGLHAVNGTFLKAQNCAGDEPLSLFQVYPGARLLLQNVTFRTISTRSKALIYSLEGSLELLNVTFSEVRVPLNTTESGVVVHVGPAGTITLQNTLVEYLNTGYTDENSGFSSFSGFLHISGADNLLLSMVKFTYNAVFGSDFSVKSLIYAMDVYRILVSEAVFQFNLVHYGLFHITGQTHEIFISNSQFDSNFGALITLFSIKITQKDALISLLNSTITGNSAVGSVMEILGDGVSHGTLLIADVQARNNDCSLLISTVSLGNVTVNRLTAVGNGDVHQVTEMIFANFTANMEGGLSSMPVFNSTACSGTLLIENTDFLRLHKSLFNYSYCVFGSPALTTTGYTTHVPFTQLEISDITLSHNQGAELIAVQLASDVLLQRLHFENNTNLSTGQAVCLHFKAYHSVTVAVIDSFFLSNHGFQSTIANIDGIRNFTLRNTVAIGNSAIGTSAGLVLSPYTKGNSCVEVRFCVFRNNSARSNGVFSIIDSIGQVFSRDTRIKLVILDTVFEGNNAQFAGSSVTISGFIQLHGRSVVGNTRFEGNSCQNGGAALHVSGFRVHVREEKGDEEAISDSKLTFESCSFERNTGLSVFELSDSSFQLQTFTSQFLNSSVFSTTVSISHCEWTDVASEFVGNSGFDAGAVVLTSDTQFTLNRTVFRDNYSRDGAGAMSIWTHSLGTCNECVFEFNGCVTYGGAVKLNAYSVFSAARTLFRYNAAQNEGAILYSTFSSFYCWECEVTANYAGSFLAVFKDSEAVFEHGYIRNNQAMKTTPGIFLTQSTLSLLNCSAANQTGLFGAFVIASESSYLLVSGSHFTSGIAVSSGGCFCAVTSSRISVVDSNFHHCEAGLTGNILYTYSSMLTISNVTVTQIGQNMSSGAFSINEGAAEFFQVHCSNLTGSAVISLSSQIFFSESSFKNIIAYYGAALNCAECPLVTVKSSEFTNCLAKKGGAFYVFTSGAVRDDYTTIFTNSSFISNRAVNGGAIYTESVYIFMTDCYFYNNSADPDYYPSREILHRGIGASIYAVNAYTVVAIYQIVNNTFVNNTATNQGAVLYWFDTYPTFEGNVMEGNYAPYGSIIASFAIRLALLDSEDRLVPYLSDEEIPLVLELYNLASGQMYTGSIRLALVDQYDQIVTADSSSYAQMHTIEGTSSALGGRLQVDVQQGVLEFSNISFTGTPTESFDFLIMSDGINVYLQKFASDPHAYYPEVKLRGSFRDCLPGEAYLGLTCYLCEANTFSLNPTEPCNSCPPEATCLGGFNMTPKAGYWRPDIRRNIIYKCSNPDACIGSPSDQPLSLTGRCAEGYEGNLCGVCVKGFYRSDIHHCSKCPTLVANIAVTSLVAIFGLLFLALAIYLVMRGARRSSSRIAVYIKLFVDYAQLIALIATIDITWPSFIRVFLATQQKMGEISSHLYSLSCLLQEMEAEDIYFTTLAIMNLLPAVVIVLAVVVCMLLSLCRPAKSVRDQSIISGVVILFLLHLSISKVLFSAFSCREILPGEYWLSDDLSIPCWHSYHTNTIALLVVPGLVVWCFGLPLLCLLAMIRVRKHLSTSTLGVQMSFLHKGYTLKHYYWEFVALYRKVALICAVVFCSMVSTLAQGLSVLAVLLIYTYLLYRAKPFSMVFYHALGLKGLVAALVTMYVGLYFESNVTGMSHADIAASVVLFTVILLANIYFIGSWFREVIPLIVETIKQRVARVSNLEPVRVDEGSNASGTVDPSDVILQEPVSIANSV